MRQISGFEWRQPRVWCSPSRASKGRSLLFFVMLRITYPIEASAPSSDQERSASATMLCAGLPHGMGVVPLFRSPSVAGRQNRSRARPARRRTSAPPPFAGCLAGRRSGRLALPDDGRPPGTSGPIVLVGSEHGGPSKRKRRARVGFGSRRGLRVRDIQRTH